MFILIWYTSENTDQINWIIKPINKNNKRQNYQGKITSYIKIIYLYSVKQICK